MFALEIVRDAMKTAQIVRRACMRCCEVHGEQVAAAPRGCSLEQEMRLSGCRVASQREKESFDLKEATLLSGSTCLL